MRPAPPQSRRNHRKGRRHWEVRWLHRSLAEDFISCAAAQESPIHGRWRRVGSRQFSVTPSSTRFGSV